MSGLGNLPQDFFSRAFRASPVASLVCGSSDLRVLEANERGVAALPQARAERSEGCTVSDIK